MLEIEYTASAEETAVATYTFLMQRPILQMLFLFMKMACIIICVAFMLSIYYKFIRPQDILAFITALIWLFFYKNINSWIIRNTLKSRKFTDMKCFFKIDNKGILYKYNNAQPQHIEWKYLKYVLQNKQGYIIPLTGITNAGKFLWLPMRCLENHETQKDFMNFLDKSHLKIKVLDT